MNQKGEVLVVNQNHNSWSLPKGHIDPGEDALAAARREVYEESGIRQLTLVKEIGEYRRYKIGKDGGDDPSELKVMQFFLFTTSEMDLKPVDPDNPEARWVAKKEVAALLTHPKDKEFIQKTLSEL